jgi:hypothetical protein
VPIVRKRPKDRSERWTATNGARLYLEDVDAILAVLKKLGDVQLDTPDVTGTLANADEVKAEYPNRRKLHSVTVDLNGLPSVTVSNVENLALTGAQERVKEIILSRRKHGLLRLKAIGIWVMTGFLIASAWLDPVHSASSAASILSWVGRWLRLSYSALATVVVPLLVAGFVIAVVSEVAPAFRSSLRRLLGPSTQIVLMRRPASFLRRNWEGIVINLGTGLVTLVIGVMYGNRSK